MTTFHQLSSLAGETALVTGATGKIGTVICDTFIELGADLVLVDNDISKLEKLYGSLSENSDSKIKWFRCDFESAADRKDLINTLNRTYSSLDVIVNNAAFVGESDLKGWSVVFEEQALDTWRRALEVNLGSVFDLTQGLLGSLREGKGGVIVNIGSIYASVGPDWRLYEGTAIGNPVAYAASKGGLLQMTRWLATTLAPEVRVNMISPGGMLRDQPTDFITRYNSRTPLDRMGTEDDLRGAVAYLASNLSSYVTGHNLVVDGGWTVW